MPTAIVDQEPPPIPGLFVYPVGAGRWEVRGPVDALEVLGVNLDHVKGAMPIIAKPIQVPEGVVLKPFQDIGVKLVAAIMRRHGAAILADEMGLGKTPQGAVLAEGFRGIGGTVLVVCPAAVRHQWQAWAGRIYQGPGGEDNFANLGPPSASKANQAVWSHWSRGGAAWAAVSYNLMEKAMGHRCPDVVVFDEPHNYMQGRGNTYVKVMWKYGSRIRYKLALTGSPYLSKPAGLWSILNVLLGNRFGRAREFDLRYCNGHDGKYGWENKGAANIPELSARLSHYMVRRTKAEVMTELPRVTRVVRWIDGSKQATAAMATMDYTTAGMRRALEPTLQDKVGEVVDVVVESDRPNVVFCWRRQDAEDVGKALAKAKQECLVIHGLEDAATRAKRVVEAAARKIHVVTTYGASGTGLDGLQAWISNMVFHAVDPVPATLLQAVARCDRMGQKEPVTATFVAMRNSVDEITVDRVVDRLDIFGQVLGRDKSSVSLRDALLAGGLGDIDDDKVLNAIFDSLT